ncbi:transposase-like protein [Mesorhizobium sp. USDA 4775]
MGTAWRRAWGEVVPFFAFPDDVRRIIYTTDEIDKRFLSDRDIISLRGRPRGEARRTG